MRIRIENILLCILWMSAVTLGSSFWFNTAFGFNIFSSEHWAYIASLQATQTPIKTGFYVSIAIIIFITIFGLYMIVRPRIRKIRLPKAAINKTKISDKTIESPAIQNNDASTIDIIQSEQHKASEEQTSYIPSSSTRPPRLVLPTLNNNFVSQSTESTMFNKQNVQPTDTEKIDLRNIFISAGYKLKNIVRINGIEVPLIAIGTNETMWLGCIGVNTTSVRTIIEKFQKIFSETLDETEIEINGFAIAAPDAAVSEFQDILMFNTLGELSEYMKDKTNPPLPPDDDGMFDAYSQYIDAVITHIGKI